MPKRGFSNVGDQSVLVRNSQTRTSRKNVDDSYSKIPTMPTVMITLEKAARNSSASIARSRQIIQAEGGGRAARRGAGGGGSLVGSFITASLRHLGSRFTTSAIGRPT